MAKTTEKRLKKPLFFAILATVLVIASAGAILSEQENGTDGSLTKSSILFKDIDGTEKYCTDPTELTTTYLASVGYELDTKWYYSEGYKSFSQAIKIVGDVRIILIGETSVINNGIIIQEGGSLTLHGQGKSGDRLSSSGTCIVMNGGSLTNAASIRCANADRVLVNVAGGSGNIITNYGTMSVSNNNCKTIASAVDVTIVNYGTITSAGSDSYTIYSQGAATITNSSKGAISATGSSSTVIHSSGGKIANSGEIRGYGNNSTAVYIKGSATSATIVNNTNALIRASASVCIYGVGDVTNNGTIGDMSSTGCGIYMEGGQIMNRSTGMIMGDRGVILNGTGEVLNYGQIGGTDMGVEAFNASAVLLMNKNLISGGVSLPNVPNYVTLAAGSRIIGNFNIGSDPASTLTFVGVPDAALTFVKIDGNAVIGTKTVFVDIDPAGLPDTLVLGDKLTLINATGTMSGTPKNSAVPGSGYNLSLMVESGRKLVALLNSPPTYGIMLSETEHTFPSAAAGYPPQATVTITVTNTGSASTGELSIKVSGPHPGGVDVDRNSFANISAIVGSNYEEFTIAPHIGLAPGTYKATVTVGPAPGNTNPIDPVSIELAFTVMPPVVSHHEYYITAISDAGSKISPGGTVTVGVGGSQKYVFSAVSGYVISSVAVDGKPLTREKVEKGYYIFSDVHSNHTIKVTSTAAEPVILTIKIVEGNGYAEFSVNGGPYQKYVSPVPLPEGAFLTVRAYADEGYKFKEWRSGGIVYKESDVQFTEVSRSLHIDLYFAEDNADIPWLWIGGFILLVLLGSLFWFLFYYRRYYEVHIRKSSGMVGPDRIRRKKAYVFTAEGGYTGPAVYRIKEDGHWKMVNMNESGEYVIPKKEVVGNIYIEKLT